MIPLLLVTSNRYGSPVTSSVKLYVTDTKQNILGSSRLNNVAATDFCQAIHCMNYEFDPAMCCVGSGFWERHRSAIEQNAFWADEIQKEKNNPAERLAMALRNLPLPAAFREAAKALRQVIRAARSARESVNEPLTMFYNLAAAESFVSASAYIEELLEPAFNAIEMLSENDWRSLRFEYAHLGYERLPLLNKTDRRWMREAWGEPETHTTLRALSSEIWNAAVRKLIAKRVAEHAERWHQLITSEEYLARMTKVRDKIS